MQEVEGSTPTGGTCPNDSFRSNRQGYPHPVSSELANSGIRVAVGDCSVTERQRWCLSYQTGNTVHVHAKTLQTQRGRTHGAGCVRQWFRTTEPLGERRYMNWNTHTLWTQVHGKYSWSVIFVLCFSYGKMCYRIVMLENSEAPDQMDPYKQPDVDCY